MYIYIYIYIHIYTIIPDEHLLLHVICVPNTNNLKNPILRLSETKNHKQGTSNVHSLLPVVTAICVSNFVGGLIGGKEGIYDILMRRKKLRCTCIFIDLFCVFTCIYIYLCIHMYAYVCIDTYIYVYIYI